jgi:hypothetical protein
MKKKKMKLNRKLKHSINRISISAILFLLICCCSSNENISISKSELIETIEKKMAIQESSWNNGDLDDFMLSYWKSDSLMFIGKNGIQLGWQTTLSNYKKSYTNKNEMGQLKFENIDYKTINLESILVTGKWLLTRNEDLGDLSGHYTLLWKKINNAWVIVYDHSS